MKHIFTSFYLLISIACSAQICFNYDAAGNRIQRQLCISGMSSLENEEMLALYMKENQIKTSELTLENDLENLIIYPNPSSGVIQIANPETRLSSQLEVISQDGKIVYSTRVSDQPIDLLFLKPGIYYISIRKASILKTAKLFITK